MVGEAKRSIPPAPLGKLLPHSKFRLFICCRRRATRKVNSLNTLDGFVDESSIATPEVYPAAVATLNTHSLFITGTVNSFNHFFFNVNVVFLVFFHDFFCFYNYL